MPRSVVMVVDELPLRVSQILKRPKVNKSRYLSSNHSKTDRDLVHPKGMRLGRKSKWMGCNGSLRKKLASMGAFGFFFSKND